MRREIVGGRCEMIAGQLWVVVDCLSCGHEIPTPEDCDGDEDFADCPLCDEEAP